MPCGVFHLPRGLHQRRGKEPRRGQGEPRRPVGQGQGGGVGLPPETLLPTAPQGVGLKGPLPPGPPSPGRSGHGPRDHPPAPPQLASARGLGAPAAWEEGITLHPLPTGRSEALRRLWGQRHQPGDTAGDWDQRSRSEPLHRVGRGGLSKATGTQWPPLICFVLMTFHC